ncbi:hypothetical protein BKA67DRAFT_690102 [Truncatella angustata]|uniref:3-carboxymuconate cyclase n=1 Tax=Truncatella angustata TaxID=152316 RepID=A0A9P8ZYQ6_9PEZI|nr:uncharacterized protein BKA67DRAFT_690102 [Truncatella angustata]KAH6655283.1 hypothetical protein BKA67DRAFT_690102 [Truncatella angustata]KAH8200272.1 hypothetical protein TruAng_005545 [Truncatella angustata]
MTNEQDNSIIALPVQIDGTVSDCGASSTPTDGSGSSGMLATNETAAPDALFSQSALTTAGNHLFAINAGSNSVTMFAIDKNDPTNLTMVGRPVPVPGEFPNTVAASQTNKQVCVGMTGAQAGISCASFSSQGIGAMDTLRVFDIGQSTPPVGPENTVSQVFYSGDGSTLFATVKGNPAVNKTGFLAAFPVQGGIVSQQGVQSSPDGTAVLFGSTPIPGSSNIFVTDASFGAAVLSIDKAGASTVAGKGAVDGQAATCWATISPATNTAFVTDVGKNRLVEVSTTSAMVMGQIDLSANGDPGLIDLKAAGKFIYALSPGNGTTQAAMTVVNAVSKQQVQHLQLDMLGARKTAQGVAILL